MAGGRQIPMCREFGYRIYFLGSAGGCLAHYQWRKVSGYKGKGVMQEREKESCGGKRK